MSFKQPDIDTSPHVSDEIRKTTCYMRLPVWHHVHIKTTRSPISKATVTIR